MGWGDVGVVVFYPSNGIIQDQLGVGVVQGRSKIRRPAFVKRPTVIRPWNVKIKSYSQ